MGRPEYPARRPAARRGNDREHCAGDAANPETNGTNGTDLINGEANEDVLFGQGGADTINGDDADLLGAASAADANPGDDYIEGNGGVDTIRGDLGEDDITGGGSASHTGANGLLDGDRDGTLDPTRSGETLRDVGDVIHGDSGTGTGVAGDVVAGDNARIQRKLETAVGPTLGDWRTDAARGTKLRDVFLFDVRIVGAQTEPGPGNAVAGESGPDTINGNGGNDILLGQDNGQSDDAAGDAYGHEAGGAGAADCQTSLGPGRATIAGGIEFPDGDEDTDELPDLNDPACRVTNPAGDTITGEAGQDYIEGNAGSDNLYGNHGEDDVVGGSSTSSD